MHEYRILMLEDSPFDVELIQYQLKKQDFQASYYVASDRAQFEEAIRYFDPNIVLSDNSLPDINAKEALEISRKIWPHIPFIMVSGTVNEDFATEIIRSGGDDYILKDRIKRLPLAIETAIKKRTEEKMKDAALSKLRENEEKYRTLVERVTDAFISLDKNFCYTYLNRQAAELIRRDPMELIGRNVWEVFPDAIGSPTHQSFQKALTEQTYICSIDYYEPFDLWQENHIYPSEDGLSIFIRDISEQKRSQAALQQMERQMMEQKLAEQRNTTKLMLRAQENERNRLGLELHDNINQMLAACMLSLGRAVDHSPELITGVMDLLSTTIGEIRTLSSRYVTPLKDINLEELTRSMLQKLQATTGLDTELYYAAAPVHDDDLKLNVYRILQEGINNIVKYANATKVHVNIISKDGILYIQLEDNGKGFDTSSFREGIGISNITSRTEIFSGTCNIFSSPGKGCSIHIEIPVKE